MAGDGFKWFGKKIQQKAGKAAERAVNQVMREAVKSAKQNHPGWDNITTAAEGSVRILDFAKFRSGVAVGLWGSRNVNYVIWLELNHGSFLRRAGDIEYKRLPSRLAENFKRAGF